MSFGASLKTKLDRSGYSLISEFVTSDRRLAVRLHPHGSNKTFRMYLSDAVELTRGVTTVAAIDHRNRHVAFVP